MDPPGSSEVSGEEAALVLQQLCLYVPRGRGGGVFGDGPASLARLRPYRRKEVAAALRQGRTTLAGLSLRQLAGLASALAAARHEDPAFMMALGDETVRRLRDGRAKCEWGPTCHLALAFARMRLAHTPLMEAVAAAATLTLERGVVKLHTRRRASQLAALLGAFAALRLRPARLLAAVGEILKQQPSPLAHMGPWECVVLVWALGRLEGRSSGFAMAGGYPAADPTMWALVLGRATTQVGQLPRHDLCRAYAMLAAAGVDHPPLLAALRRAVRERLNLLKPRQLSALVVGLAGLGHRDPLLTDELAIWVHNKAINFSPAELASTMAGLAVLRYRNPWLLGRLSRILASPGLGRLRAMTGAELATVAAAAVELRWPNSLLLDALGDEAASRLGWTTGGGSSGGESSSSSGSSGSVGSILSSPPANRQSMAPDELAKLVSSLAALRHRHAGLLAAACAFAAVEGTKASDDGGSGWRLADCVAVTWAAAVFGAAPSVLLQRAATEAAGDPGLPLDQLVRLAWACAAHDFAVPTAPGVNPGVAVGADGGGMLAGLVPLLQQRLAAVTSGSGGTGLQARLQQLAVLGPELPQLVEAARRLTGAALLPAAVEGAYATAASAALAQGPRGATLRQVAAELDAVLSQHSSAGAPPRSTLRLGYRVPGTLLVADIAVLSSRDGGLIAPASKLAVLLIDASAADTQDTAGLLACAAFQSSLFASAGFRVAYLRAEGWAEAGALAQGDKQKTRKQLTEALLANTTTVNG